jgi:hypothetical protein
MIAGAIEKQIPIEPVVGQGFASVCVMILLDIFIMAAILAAGHDRPVPTYAIIGSLLFGGIFGAFIMGAVHLAVTDARRDKHG